MDVKMSDISALTLIPFYPFCRRFILFLVGNKIYFSLNLWAYQNCIKIVLINSETL